VQDDRRVYVHLGKRFRPHQSDARPSFNIPSLTISEMPEPAESATYAFELKLLGERLENSAPIDSPNIYQCVLLSDVQIVMQVHSRIAVGRFELHYAADW